MSLEDKVQPLRDALANYMQTWPGGADFHDDEAWAVDGVNNVVWQHVQALVEALRKEHSPETHDPEMVFLCSVCALIAEWEPAEQSSEER